MADNFETQIDQIVVNTKQRLLNVVVQSLADLVKEAQKTTLNGGKMRVDTGFLRRSGAGSLEGMPVGAGRGRKRGAQDPASGVLPEYKYDEQQDFLTVILNKMKIGDVFYWGWTATYAKYREAYDGFLETSLQNWQGYVDKSVEFYRKRDARK